MKKKAKEEVTYAERVNLEQSRLILNSVLERWGAKDVQIPDAMYVAHHTTLNHTIQSVEAIQDSMVMLITNEMKAIITAEVTAAFVCGFITAKCYKGSLNACAEELHALLHSKAQHHD